MPSFRHFLRYFFGRTVQQSLANRGIPRPLFVIMLSWRHKRDRIENEVAAAESCLFRSAYAELLNEKNTRNLLRLSETCDRINS